MILVLKGPVGPIAEIGRREVWRAVDRATVEASPGSRVGPAIDGSRQDQAGGGRRPSTADRVIPL